MHKTFSLPINTTDSVIAQQRKTQFVSTINELRVQCLDKHSELEELEKENKQYDTEIKQIIKEQQRIGKDNRSIYERIKELNDTHYSSPSPPSYNPPPSSLTISEHQQIVENAEQSLLEIIDSVNANLIILENIIPNVQEQPS